MCRGKKVDLALNTLKFDSKVGSKRLEKLLLSAIANWQEKNKDDKIEDADLFVKEIIPVIRKIQAADRTTLQEIADSLMDQRKLTPRGKKTWTPTTVRLLLIRAEKLRR